MLWEARRLRRSEATDFCEDVALQQLILLRCGRGHIFGAGLNASRLLLVGKPRGDETMKVAEFL